MKRIVYILCLMLLFVACLKKRNEVPDTKPGSDPKLALTFSLEKLNALLPAEGMPVLIDSEWVVYGIIRANDASGNLYNQLIIEDSSAGMAVLLDENNLFSKFPADQKIYLRLKGLYLGNNHGTLQLGAFPVADNSGLKQVSAIQSGDFARYIVLTNVSVSFEPPVVSMSYLSEPRKELVNRLIKIEQSELANPEQDLQYADAAAATSIRLQDCNGAGIVLRTSNYAGFQSYPTPYGMGSITAIYTVYNGAGQLTIRDTNDVKMGPVRCDGSIRQAPALITIETLRGLYKGRDTLPGHLAISGVVTSDAVNRNFGAGNIIVQQGKNAIMVYFGGQATGMPDLGDSVLIKLSGATLTRYNGILEIKNIKTLQVEVLSTGKITEPLHLDIAELNKRFAELESVLVKISNAKITSPGNYGGSKTLRDTKGDILLYTSNSAVFANMPVPVITKTFQGIVTPYDTTKELKIRNPALDVY